MRFAFVSHVGDSLPMWMRVQAEGHEVMAYVPDRGSSYIHRNTGRGLVPLASSKYELLAWARESPTVFVFDLTHEGSLADEVRKAGHLVIGGGSFCDRLEEDRTFGERIAAECGIRIPETKRFPTISATLDFLKGAGKDADWYFKINADIAISSTAHGEAESLTRRLESFRDRYRDSLSNILQETIAGVDISTAGWWNGRDFLHPFEGTVENKKLMNDDLGPATGCSFNVVWFYEDRPQIVDALHFEKIAEAFRREGAPPGIYDVNSIISKADGEPYFLEWTPRFGYDSEPSAMNGVVGELAEFYYNLATGRAAEAPFDTSEAQMSVRLSVPPYPLETVDKFDSRIRDRASGAVGVPFGGLDHDALYGPQFLAYGLGLRHDGALICMDPTGIVGLACAAGTDVETMNREILAFVKDELDVPDLQYRSDAGKSLAEHLGKIADLGYDVGPLMVE